MGNKEQPGSKVTIVVTGPGDTGAWTARATDGVIDLTACRETMAEAASDAAEMLHRSRESLRACTAAVKAAEADLKRAVERLENVRCYVGASEGETK